MSSEWNSNMTPVVLSYIRSSCRLAFVLGFVFTVLCGCGRSRDADQMHPLLFAKVYTDLILAALDTTGVDSTSKLEQVLLRHQLDRKTFDATSLYFQQKPEVWLDILEQVTKELEDKAQNEN